MVHFQFVVQLRPCQTPYLFKFHTPAGFRAWVGRIYTQEACRLDTCWYWRFQLLVSRRLQLTVCLYPSPQLSPPLSWFWNIADSCHVFKHVVQVLFGCLKAPQCWREGIPSRYPLPIKKGNRWKQKKEISNSLLSHTRALAIAESQKDTHILQIVWLKNTMLSKVKQIRGYIVHSWNSLVKCQPAYGAELFFQWKYVLNESWCKASIRTVAEDAIKIVLAVSKIHWNVDIRVWLLQVCLNITTCPPSWRSN